MESKIKAKANELYELYENDYSDFKNSRLRAIEHCNKNISRSETIHERVFWIDVKTELKTNY